MARERSCCDCEKVESEPFVSGPCGTCGGSDWVYRGVTRLQLSTGETQKAQITALTEEVRSLKQSLKSEQQQHLQTLERWRSRLQLNQKLHLNGAKEAAKSYAEGMVWLVGQELESFKERVISPPLISTPDTTPKPTSFECTSLETQLLTLLKSDPETEWTWTEKCGPTTTGGYSHTISISLTKIVSR